MKILMVNKFLYPKGGSETYMLKLGRYLQSIGHDVQYFGMLDEKNIVGNQIGAYASTVDYHNYQNGILESVKTAINTIYSKSACAELRKVLSSFQPDIVHLNNINFQLTPGIIYEIRKFEIPIVQTVHDVQIACPCHRFYIEHKQAICEECQNNTFWKCVKNKCVHGSLKKSAIATIESYYYHLRNTYNQVDMYICPSRFIAKKIAQAGVEKKRLTVMYNFSDNVEGISKIQCAGKYVLYFGRFSKEKGIETLLSVSKNLPHVRFVFAGIGPLIDMVKDADEKFSNVEYVGFKTGKELQRLIAGATFSVYPSEGYENCPLSVIESQNLGTPVIASDLGGTKELIVDHKTGLIFKGCDEQALTKSIDKLWNDNALIQQMTEQCLDWKNNTIVEYTRDLLVKYNNLIEKAVQKHVK